MSKNNDKNVLEVLLGSKVRVKILKFFFRNYPNPVGLRDLSNRVQEDFEDVKKEINTLWEIRLIRKRK